MVQKRPSQPGRRDGRVGGNRIGVTRLHAGQTNAQPIIQFLGQSVAVQKSLEMFRRERPIVRG